ncbi:hypothetical protein ACRCPT_07065 [Pseudomonas aeruginosa]|uniref:hypothetical protein n=1 Tax=Ectopseudomonas guguanensis TaxID=1198456 RepID=UPI0028611B4C|nr:hypothetical protein [Pseudomonas guguanensis]MDR8015634.1 hypothetical protein [Pseudomonas guguanensis]
MSERDDEEERFIDQVRPWIYLTAFMILIGASIVIPTVTEGSAFKVCRAAGNSPFSCWVN